MSTEANKAFIREYLEAFRKDKSRATLEKYMTDESLMQHIAESNTTFPGYWLDIEAMVAEGDLVNVRATARGSHGGPLGSIPATGKQLEAPMFITYRIANGKIAEHWLLVDNLSILQQIGVIPAMQ